MAPGFPSPGQHSQVSVPGSSRRVRSGSDLRLGKAAGIAPSAPSCAARAAPGLAPAHPRGAGGVAEQFGDGSRDPLGAPSTPGGYGARFVPWISPTSTFWGAWLNCGAGNPPLQHSVTLPHGERDVGVQSPLGAHTAPQNGCLGGSSLPNSHGGAQHHLHGRTAGHTDGVGGLSPLSRAQELPSRAWSSPTTGISPRLHFPGVASPGYWLQLHLSSCPKIFSSRYMSLIHAG